MGGRVATTQPVLTVLSRINCRLFCIHETLESETGEECTHNTYTYCSSYRLGEHYVSRARFELTNLRSVDTYYYGIIL